MHNSVTLSELSRACVGSPGPEVGTSSPGVIASWQPGPATKGGPSVLPITLAKLGSTRVKSCALNLMRLRIGSGRIEPSISAQSAAT